MAGDSTPVPAQQGLWRDEPANSLRPGQGRRHSTQQGPVLVGQLRSVVVSAGVQASKCSLISMVWIQSGTCSMQRSSVSARKRVMASRIKRRAGFPP